MSDKWNRSIKHDFNKAATGKVGPVDEGSAQVKNTKLRLQGGPPPPKGPGMAVARQRHREDMAKDHQRATGEREPAPARRQSANKEAPRGKGDLNKDFTRSR